MYTRFRNKGVKLAVPPKGNGVSTAFNGSTQSFPSGGLQPFAWVTTIKEPYVETRDCEVLHFHRRRASGETFFNPFETVRETRFIEDQALGLERQEGLYSGEQPTAWRTTVRPDTLMSFSSAMGRELNLPYDAVFGPDLAAISEVVRRNAAQRDVALNAALSEIAKTDALALVSLAELHKTIGMIGKYAFALNSRFAGLRDLAYNFWRNPRGMSREAALALAREYLSIRYGVMPLVYDIQGVVNALTAPAKGERVTARGRSVYGGTKTRQVTLAAYGFYPPIVLDSTTVITAGVRAGCLFEPVVSTIADRLGLHPAVLPEVFFELTKLSFVADWFFDLSDTIRALRADVHGKIVGGWITEEVTSQTTHTASCVGQVTAYVTVNGQQRPTTWKPSSTSTGATAYAFRTAKTRTPVGAPSARMPSSRVRLNNLRVADALAIVATTFAGISASSTRTIRL